MTFQLSIRSGAARFIGLCALLVAASSASAQALPRVPPDHVVVLILENRSPELIIGRMNIPFAPYLNELAARGAVMSQSYAVAHPSQPNYLALFSGSTHGVGDNRCNLSLDGPTLAQQLIDAGRTFVGYAEGLPSPDFTGCTSGRYVRKHAPWINFPALPKGNSRPMSAFPKNFDRLPTVSFVVPDLDHDMHDGTVLMADTWIKANLGKYVDWAMTHNALLIVTYDEDDSNSGNHIPTLLVGQMVKPGVYDQRITHYGMFRTLEALYGLPFVDEAKGATTIDTIWK